VHSGTLELENFRKYILFIPKVLEIFEENFLSIQVKLTWFKRTQANCLDVRYNEQETRMLSQALNRAMPYNTTAIN